LATSFSRFLYISDRNSKIMAGVASIFSQVSSRNSPTV
jgi:hypothetical protein